MTTNVKTTKDALAIGDSVRSLALSFARKTGAAIDSVVVSTADHKHEFSLGPIKLYHAIRDNLSKEEIDELPKPGSKWNDPEFQDTVDENGKIIRCNEMPDIAQWKDPSKPDGKAKEISFYVVWADGTPEGQHAVTELEWCSRVSQENMKTDDIPKEWLAKYAGNPQEIKKRKKYLEGRRATVRKAYKDTVSLIWQLDMVNELDGVGAKLDADAGENTVLVYNKSKPEREWKLYSVGSFLRLDPLKASEQDGSYAALEATAKRESNGGGDKGTKPGEIKLNSIQTPESSDKVATAWHLYLDEALNDRKGDKYTALIRHLTSDGGRQAVLTMAGIRDRLNGLFMMDQIRAIADTEKEKLNRAA